MSSSSDLRALPKLKPEIKKRWLKALRSGDYKQATGQLRKNGAFCCLGVLCDVVKNDKELRITHGGDLDWDKGLSETDLVPHEEIVSHVFGRRNHINDCDFDPLTNRNDGGGERNLRRRSFSQIANIIERHM